MIRQAKGGPFPDVFYQFIRFCGVGVLGATLNYSIFFILLYFFSVQYIISSATGFILSVFLAFSLNKRFTFKNHNQSKSKILRYFSVNFFSLIIGLISLGFFVRILLLNEYFANFLTVGITTVLNFAGSKLFVFNK